MKKLDIPTPRLNAEAPAARQIYSHLRSLIIVNTLQPGMRLSENDLAARFEVSRQPVREALTHLEHDGLLEIKPQRGSFIRKISVPNLEGICFVRCAIESQAILESASLSPQDFSLIIKGLESNLNAQRALSGPTLREDFLRLDDDFHRIICSFARNDLPWELIQSVKANMDRIRFFTIEGVSRLENLIAAHAAVLEGIRTHNVFLAVGMLKEHLYEILSTYKMVMAENADWFD